MRHKGQFPSSSTNLNLSVEWTTSVVRCSRAALISSCVFLVGVAGFSPRALLFLDWPATGGSFVGEPVWGYCFERSGIKSQPWMTKHHSAIVKSDFWNTERGMAQFELPWNDDPPSRCFKRQSTDDSPDSKPSPEQKRTKPNHTVDLSRERIFPALNWVVPALTSKMNYPSTSVRNKFSHHRNKLSHHRNEQFSTEESMFLDYITRGQPHIVADINEKVSIQVKVYQLHVSSKRVKFFGRDI